MADAVAKIAALVIVSASVSFVEEGTADLTLVLEVYMDEETVVSEDYPASSPATASGTTEIYSDDFAEYFLVF